MVDVETIKMRSKTRTKDSSQQPSKTFTTMDLPQDFAEKFLLILNRRCEFSVLEQDMAALSLWRATRMSSRQLDARRCSTGGR